MFEFSHINEAETYLVKTLSGDRFLRSAGDLSNSSCFVAPYPPEQQPAAELMVKQVVRDLKARGVNACVVNAYDEMLAVLDEDGFWGMYVEIEPSVSAVDLTNALQDSIEVRGPYAQRFSDRVTQEEADLLIITGVGAAFPIVRVHTLVEVVNPGVPVLVMFPGRQTVRPDGKRSLDVLTTPPGENQGKYRARNIFDF